MNAERLHAVIEFIAKEYSDKAITTTWAELTTALQQAISSPTSPDIARNFHTKFKTFKESLDRLDVSQLPPSYREILEEIGALPFLGRALSSKFEEILASSSVAVAGAIPLLQQQQQAINAFITEVNAMLTAFRNLHVPKDEVPSGKGEVGFLIPKTLFDPTLGALNKEIRQLDVALRGINELATNNAEAVELRAISSSEWQLFLIGSIAFLEAVDWLLKKIASIMKSMGEIKSNWQSLVKMGLPEQHTAPLKQYIDSYIEGQISELAKEAVDRYYHGAEVGRRNELETQVRQACHFLASQIDSGVKIDLRLSATIAPAAQGDGAEYGTPLPDISQLRAELQSTTAQLEDLRKMPGGQLKLMPPEIGEA